MAGATVAAAVVFSCGGSRATTIQTADWQQETVPPVAENPHNAVPPPTAQPPKQTAESPYTTEKLTGAGKMKNELNSPRGRTWDEAEKEFFTSAEIAASDLRVAMMVELALARKETILYDR